MGSRRFLFRYSLIISLVFTSAFNLHAQNYISSGEGWRAIELFSAKPDLPVYESPDEESRIKSRLAYLSKALVIEDERDILNFGWSKIAYPVNGYVNTEYLVTESSLQENYLPESTNYWHAEIVYGSHEYSFLKATKSFDSRNAAVLKENTPALIIVNNELPQQAWYRVVYPVSGYIYSNDLQFDDNRFSFEFGLSFSPVNIPYEKNMKNLSNPLGGYLKFTNEGWKLGVKLYYTIGKSHLNTYELETHRGGIVFSYDFLSLFNDALAVYGFAGGGYWASTFENTKYPSMKSYFKTENASGFMYNTGAGFNYTYYGFVLDVHYSFFGTEEGVFGDKPLPGQFTNQYKLFTASNQVVTMLGYKIAL